MHLETSLQGNPSHDCDGRFNSVIEDVREQRKAFNDCKILEASLQKSFNRLSNLHQIDKAILEAQDPQAIAKIAINNIQKLSNHQRVSIVTFDSVQSTATILATQGENKASAEAWLQVSSTDIWQDLIARIEKCDRDYIIYYSNQSSQLVEAIPLFREAALDCSICFPLRANGKLIGILQVWSENLWAVAEEELDMISEVCSQIAIAFRQADLYQQTQNYALELEARVAERTAQLEEIDRELKAFTYSISHVLKAPLRAVQGFATAIQEDYSENLDELGLEYTQRLVASTQQMEQLIHDLLAYSRLSRTEIHLRFVDLSEVVKQAIAGQELVINQRGVEIAIDEPLLTVFGNKTILLQVVDNLLSNAIKFIPPKITPKIHIWTEVIGDRWRMWV